MAVIEKAETFEIRGKGYNIMTRKADNFGNFKLDLLLTDPEQIKKAQDLKLQYNLNLKDDFTYMEDKQVKTMSGPSLTFRAKYDPNGNFPRTSIPMKKADTSEVIQDYVSHGADVTVRFRIYPFKAGTNAQGVKYKAGNGFQLEEILVHSYEAFKAAS